MYTLQKKVHRAFRAHTRQAILNILFHCSIVLLPGLPPIRDLSLCALFLNIRMLKGVAIPHKLCN